MPHRPRTLYSSRVPLPFAENQFEPVPDLCYVMFSRNVRR